MKRSSRPVLILLSVVIALVTAAILLLNRDPAIMKLPGGTTLQWVGVSHGRVLARGPLTENSVGDMDGNLWLHQPEPPDARWLAKIYRVAPAAIQKHLPSSWKSTSADEWRIASSEAMVWKLSGPFDGKRWRLTWVDKNGFESEGHTDGSTLSLAKRLNVNVSTPPCHSPYVILRVRERVENKPIAEWPLLGEQPMKNPCLMPPSTAPAMKFPATLTRDGVTVTMHSLTVNPQAKSSERVTAMITISPEAIPKGWTARMIIYDARHAGISTWRAGSKPKEGGLQLNTSACLWSDGPWLVRVKVRPRAGSTVAGTSFGTNRLRLDHVAVPGDKDAGASSPAVRTGAIGSWQISLNPLMPSSSKRWSAWMMEFTRPDLGPDREFEIISIHDDKRRVLEWQSRHTEWPEHGPVTCGWDVKRSTDPEVKSIDVEVGIEKILAFDFQVLPEFLPSAP